MVGENFSSAGNEDFLSGRGVEVIFANASDCIALMKHCLAAAAAAELGQSDCAGGTLWLDQGCKQPDFVVCIGGELAQLGGSGTIHIITHPIGLMLD